MNGNAYPESRGLFLGDADESALELLRIAGESHGVIIRFASDLNELIEQCYSFEPLLILARLGPRETEILSAASRDGKFRRSVTIGLAAEPNAGYDRLVEEHALTEVYVLTGDIARDAEGVMNRFRANTKFGLNMKTLTEGVPTVNDLVWHDYSREELRLRRSISDKLVRLGVRRNLAGHKYLIAAIALQSVVCAFTEPNKLYKRVAEYYEVSPAAVEKAVRYAIESAWTRGDIDYQHEVFGLTVDENRGKPTNAEFISQLALDVL